MRGFSPFGFLALLTLGFAATAIAVSVGVELDADGVVGNGPDTIAVGVGEPFQVDVWITGEGGMIVEFGIALCLENHPFQYPGLVLGPEMEGWEIGPLIGDPCFSPDAWDTTLAGMAPPFLGMILYYQLDTPMTAELAFEECGAIFTNGESAPYDPAIGALVQVGTTGTDRRSWGRIKRLFR